jgi:predicted enzyme related to lactoylglutathione lyase
MSGPARAGVFIYAKNLERMTAFYEQVLDMRRLHARDDLAVLDSPDLQVVLHAIPEAIGASIAIATPPVPRENSAYKFFHTVPSIEAARERATAAGGDVVLQQWSGPGFVVCNAVDPEGNVFQLRQAVD